MAARSVTARHAPSPRFRRSRAGRSKTGKGGAGSFSARALAADYVKLCHHPTKDLKRWIAEDKKTGPSTLKLRRAGRAETTTKGEKHGQHAEKGAIGLAEAVRLRGEVLHELCGGLDAHGEGRRLADRLPSRPRASVGGHGRLRSLRAEGRAALLSRAANDNAKSTNVRAQFRTARAYRSRAPAWRIVDSDRARWRVSRSQYRMARADEKRSCGLQNARRFAAHGRRNGRRRSAGITGGAKPDTPTRPATVTRRTGEASGPT